MNGLTADFAALDGCRKTMLGQAGQFGGLADGFSARDIDPSMFGTLPASGALAELAGRVDAGIGAQFSAAERFLRSVERALDAVRQGVADAEKSNVKAIRAI
jgi:hypothetical protein